MKLPSSNRYFYQDSSILREDRRSVDLYLQLKGYTLEQRDIYLKAYDYFVFHPEQFDGATMTEDLFDIGRLELGAMLHDYLYISFGASASFRYTWLADKLLRSEMGRMNKSTWNTGVRFFLLLIKTPCFVPYCYLKGRRMVRHADFHTIYNTLTPTQ